MTINRNILTMSAKELQDFIAHQRGKRVLSPYYLKKGEPTITKLAKHSNLSQAEIVKIINEL